MAGRPAVRVEIELTAGTWTDITAWWLANRPLSATGGRSDVDAWVAPGRLTGLALDNTDGRWTVGNPAGAHWPNVASGRRVRYSIQDPVTTSWMVRWTGSVDGWPLFWEDNGSTCVATVSGTDALLGLTAAIPPGAWMRYVVEDLAGAAWYWPMTDDPTDRSHAEASGGPAMIAGTSAPRPSQAGPGGDPRPLPAIGDGTDNASWAAFVESGAVSGWGSSMLFKASSQPPQTPIPMYVGAGGGWVAAWITTDGFLRVAASWGGPYGSQSVNICDGRWWLLTLGASGEDDNSIFAGATLVEDPTVYTDASVSEITDAQALLDSVPRVLNVRVSAAATVGHAAWRADLNTGILAALGGFPSEATIGSWGTRWNAAFAPDVTVASAGLGNWWLTSRPIPATMLEAWAPVEAVDGGITFADRDGTLKHWAGDLRARPANGGPLATLTAADIDPSWAVGVDRLDLCNRVTVTAKDPVTGRTYGQVTVSNPDSVTRYGAIEKVTEVAGASYSRTGDSTWVYVFDERAVEPIASALLVTAEAPRVPSFTVDVMTLTAAQQQDLLAVGMWDLIAVTGLPTAGGMPTAWLGRVEGWTETVAVDQWRITFNVSGVGAIVGDSTFARVGTMRLG